MATTPPTKQDRDANLEALRTAVNQWSNKEITRLDHEAKFFRSVLQGRGANDVGTKNMSKASALTMVEINSFILKAP